MEKVDPKKEQKWDFAITESKNIRKSMKLPQLQIAELALSVCEITWGGAKKEIKNNPFTLTRFSKECGVSYKSLSSWVSAYRNVYSRIPNNLRKKITFTDICNIGKKVTKETPREKVKYEVEKYISQDSFEHKVGRYLRDLRSLHYNFSKNAAALRVDDKLLEEVVFYCEGILAYIKEDKQKIISKDNNLANHYDGRNQSAAKAVLGKRESKDEVSKL